MPWWRRRRRRTMRRRPVRRRSMLRTMVVRHWAAAAYQTAMHPHLATLRARVGLGDGRQAQQHRCRERGCHDGFQHCLRDLSIGERFETVHQSDTGTSACKAALTAPPCNLPRVIASPHKPLAGSQPALRMRLCHGRCVTLTTGRPAPGVDLCGTAPAVCGLILVRSAHTCCR